MLYYCMTDKVRSKSRKMLEKQQERGQLLLGRVILDHARILEIRRDSCHSLIHLASSS